MVKQESGWKYTPDVAEDAPKSSEPAETKSRSVTWTALTGTEGHKNFLWYLILVLTTGLIAAAVYFTTKDKISTSVIVFCGLVICFYGSKKPKELKYSMDSQGFTINKKQYSFNGFKSFYVINVGNQITVALRPLKRFMPYSYISLKQDIADKVTSLLGNSLPMEKAKYDPLDRLFRFIGF